MTAETNDVVELEEAAVDTVADVASEVNAALPQEGEGGETSLSSQAGYLPVPLRCVPPECLQDLQVYLNSSGIYSLYCSKDLQFSTRDRDRLLASGIENVYVSVRDHHKYYAAMENCIVDIVGESTLHRERKAEILYSTTMELANELLEGPPGPSRIRRSGNISKAIVEMAFNDEKAFGALFDVSSHDFYTATHMVNVCTYAVCVAQKLGITDKGKLQALSMGALLHDIGKVFVPPEILNTTERLSDDQFEIIKSHVQRGYDHLMEAGTLPKDAMGPVYEHHERLDGSGYPQGLRKDEISDFGKIVAVVDTFDAMTSVRPYRDKSFSIEQTLEILTDESVTKYDMEVVRALISLVNSDVLVLNPVSVGEGEVGGVQSRRRHERHFFHFPLIVRIATRENGKLTLGEPQNLLGYNLSRSGIGFLSPRPLAGETILCLSFTSRSDGPTHNVAAIVVRSQNHLNGWYTVGARFHEVQDEAWVRSIRDMGTPVGR